MKKLAGNKKTPTQKIRRVGHVQKKILLLLSGGLVLGLAHSPKQSLRVIREIGKQWKEIDRHALNQAIRALYESKLIESKDNRDGTITLVLSEEGKQLTLSYNLEEITIKQPTHWDGKWRVVMFDVPENLKRMRDTLRMHFKNMGFYEFQKSVFVHPYPCKDEITYIMEFYNARRHIRFIIATDIDNALELKKHFGLKS